MGKVTALTADATPSTDDLVYTVNDPGGTPASRKATLANVWGLFRATTGTLTTGFDSSDHNAGTKSSGTYTPAASDGNFQYAVNGGAHTLAPPATSCSIVVQYTNNGSAGGITTSSFTIVTGDSFTTTNGDDFMCVLTRCNGFSVLNVTALQ